ncbi:MAG TPA: hypothetical protein VLS49_05385 [Usitatibacter sp.]|nr:hypothetical protein [Usitatibacter sp.]
MPIRAENKKRYPKDWPAISQRIRARAGNVCERCKAPNDTVIFRGDGLYILPNGETRDDVTGEYLTMTRGSELPSGRFVRVVLTVAHLDHTPENCADENLRALCQACHNRYDAPMRAAGRKERREAASPQGKLFGGAP